MGSSVIERVHFLKSLTLLLNPQCIGNPTKYLSQFAVNCWKDRTKGNIQRPLEIVRIKTTKWNAIIERAHRTAGSRSCGWDAYRAALHSLLITDSPYLPNAVSKVPLTTGIKPLVTGPPVKLIVRIWRRYNGFFIKISRGRTTSLSPSSWSVYLWWYVWLTAYSWKLCQLTIL